MVQEGVIDETACCQLRMGRGFLLPDTDSSISLWQNQRGQFDPDFVTAFEEEYGLTPYAQRWLTVELRAAA